jgi:hypothetical protein
VKQYATVSPAVSDAFTPADLTLVASKVLAKCDALDGAADGMVNDTAACQAAFNFSTDVPQCAAGVTADGTCLSAAQKTALGKVFAGAKDSAGTLLYSNFAWDPGLAGSGWSLWKTVLNPNLGSIAMGNVWATPPAPTITFGSPAATSYWQNFQMDEALALINTRTATFTESSTDFMGMPASLNLTTLKAKGKLLIYHGTADPVFSSNYTQAWYDALRGRDSHASDYARVFFVPGMNHCGGGPATDQFDSFTPWWPGSRRGRRPTAWWPRWLRTMPTGLRPGQPRVAGRCAPIRRRQFSTAARLISKVQVASAVNDDAWCVPWRTPYGSGRAAPRNSAADRFCGAKRSTGDCPLLAVPFRTVAADERQ